MSDDVDYKKLWFDVCEEKKSLQLENIALSKKIDYLEVENKSLGVISNKYMSVRNRFVVNLNLFLDDLKCECVDFECCLELIDRVKKFDGEY